MTAADALDRGRASFGRQAWGEAYAQLSAADRRAALDPVDLERLAMAAHLVGRDSESADAYARAKAAMTREGMEIVTDDPASGRIEAVATSFWYGFKDDLVARVAPEGSGARVDMRSVSRVGMSDLGQNCKRITRLAAAIRQG